MTSVVVANSPRPLDIAFGSLIDLAMMRTGAVSVEVCEVCHTINLGAARLCKGCNHKLPAFYGEAAAEETALPESRPSFAHKHGWTWDLAAFWLVVNSLAGVTALGQAW